MDLVLRPFVRDDFARMGEWLREDLVAEWWHDDPDPAVLERRYGPAIDGREPTALRIAEVLHEPAGFVQWYRFADEPEYTAELAPFVPIPADAWSLDYLVAASHRRRGVGTAMIRAALAELGPEPVIVPVHAENRGSAGVLRAAGFTVVTRADLEPDNPAHSREHLVLARSLIA